MAQAIHILRKDILALRVEIGVLFAAVIGLVALEGQTALLSGWTPVFAAAVFLVVRLIQLESLPGDRQFWITRPYRRSSLVAAKLAFLVLFVSTPIAAAQIALFTFRDGFGLPGNLGPILWSAALAYLVVILPVAALAALTRNIVQFVLVAFGIGGVFYLSRAFASSIPSDVVWVRHAILAVLAIVGAIVILVVQYRFGRTAVAALAAVGVLATTVAVQRFLSPELALAIQENVGSDQFDARTVDLVLDPEDVQLIEERSRFYRGPEFSLSLPFGVTGVPEGVHFRVVHSTIEVQSEGRDPVRIVGGQKLTRSVRFGADAFGPEPGPVTVRASFWVTAFLDSTTTTLPRTPGEALDLGGRLSCQRRRIGATTFGDSPLLEADEVQCVRPFSWGTRSLAIVDQGRVISRRLALTSSPFPSGLDPNAIGRQRHLIEATTGPLDLLVAETVGHFRKDVALTIPFHEIEYVEWAAPGVE